MHFDKNHPKQNHMFIINVYNFAFITNYDENPYLIQYTKHNLQYFVEKAQDGLLLVYQDGELLTDCAAVV